MAEAKENLEKSKSELELAQKFAENTSDPILKEQLKKVRRRVEILLNKEYKKNGIDTRTRKILLKKRKTKA